MSEKPNFLLILNDDMGYSDIGCYGGEVQTPNLDALAAGGLKYTQFYNTARCCPSRASLLTGLYPHQADIGEMTRDDDIDGYRGDLSQNTVTIAEALKTGGYSTYMSGKWHLTNSIKEDGPKKSWPNQRGFDDFYGILTGAASYYQPKTLTRNNEPVSTEGDDYFFTDAISDEAIRQIEEHDSKNRYKPFFQYVAYTAPHWPLHAHPEDIAKYKNRFDEGWDVLRENRLKRMVDMGIIKDTWELSERDEGVPPWEEDKNKEWQSKRMEVYAAQIDRMDQGIGRIVAALEKTSQLDNTVIIFLADNGGCAEEFGGDAGDWVKRMLDQPPFVGTLKTRDGEYVQYGNEPNLMPGPENTYASYGLPWANVSNTPFRMYKHWVHEGGIATPFIVHWPKGIKEGGQLRHQPAQLPDVMATFLDLSGVEYPATYSDREIKPLEGKSFKETFHNGNHQREVLYFEHEGNRAIRKGKFKMVAKKNQPWELYDMDLDRSELHDISNSHPEIIEELSELYFSWAKRCDVLEFDDLRAIRQPKFREQRERERALKK
jgi:arylsulfatase A-like enzyme